MKVCCKLEQTRAYNIDRSKFVLKPNATSFILHEVTNSIARANIDLPDLRYRTIKAGVYREH